MKHCYKAKKDQHGGVVVLLALSFLQTGKSKKAQWKGEGGIVPRKQERWKNTAHSVSTGVAGGRG